MSEIKRNLEEIEEKIEICCGKSGRSRSDVQLVAVTKASDIEQIKEVYDLGYRVFGENRLPHFTEVSSVMSEYAGDDPVQWDMIGHMQRNKVKNFLPLSTRIHSLDSLRLAREVEKVAAGLGRKFDSFLQINCSGEQQKHGIEPPEAAEIAEQIVKECPSINLVGVMTMAAFTDDVSQIASSFRLAKTTFDGIKANDWAGEAFSRLSMGMTNDYEIAIMEGATDIRVGSAIFK
ncbi:MAG: YggS family pyridoxal phosphate-dependent enzyme [Sedimentisphaeraceae bacterium JB056]